ncbi:MULTISPECIES: DUF72 domain-containing protein [unclassified Chelatococcus]|uniref:DUF72 domain-containing protein n=1 Tax=unclassified Chelatococcus TaxID=2638111 RepID=UPI001BD17201|nr:MULTISPECIES: DUF72 domain-containing protein [unclassified Chelatococcus]MBS7696007.1 DUF72 domain-containing protein [Chelatococcus sp. YT9]MBX3557989.1 DUF72 domain-containing protein [Chelatococcus sp.]
MSGAAKGRILVGIGGWTFEPWRGVFYPTGLAQSKELQYAASHVTAIEINATYYGSQKPESFRRWAQETPEHFVFSVKGPRFATNRKVLAEAGLSIERFVESGVTELGSKLGPLLWQLAGTKRFDPVDMKAFLDLLPERHNGVALRHVIEARHMSFRDPEFLAMLRERNIAAVCIDDIDYPMLPDATADFVYLRLERSQESEKTGYPEADLDAWAKRAALWAEGDEPEDLPRVAPPPKGKDKPVPRDVFLYFISGAKVRNPAAAMAMIERLG